MPITFAMLVDRFGFAIPALAFADPPTCIWVDCVFARIRYLKGGGPSGAVRCIKTKPTMAADSQVAFVGLNPNQFFTSLGIFAPRPFLLDEVNRRGSWSEKKETQMRAGAPRPDFFVAC
jgi:hypothetical protein